MPDTTPDNMSDNNGRSGGDTPGSSDATMLRAAGTLVGTLGTAAGVTILAFGTGGIGAIAAASALIGGGLNAVVASTASEPPTVRSLCAKTVVGAGVGGVGGGVAVGSAAASMAVVGCGEVAAAAASGACVGGSCALTNTLGRKYIEGADVSGELSATNLGVNIFVGAASGGAAARFGPAVAQRVSLLAGSRTSAANAAALGGAAVGALTGGGAGATRTVTLNLANGRPVGEGFARNVALGVVVGGAAGGAVARQQYAATVRLQEDIASKIQEDIQNNPDLYRDNSGNHDIRVTLKDGVTVKVDLLNDTYEIEMPTHLWARRYKRVFGKRVASKHTETDVTVKSSGKLSELVQDGKLSTTYSIDAKPYVRIAGIKIRITHLLRGGLDAALKLNLSAQDVLRTLNSDQFQSQLPLALGKSDLLGLDVSFERVGRIVFEYVGNRLLARLTVRVSVGGGSPQDYNVVVAGSGAAGAAGSPGGQVNSGVTVTFNGPSPPPMIQTAVQHLVRAHVLQDPQVAQATAGSTPLVAARLGQDD